MEHPFSPPTSSLRLLPRYSTANPPLPRSREGPSVQTIVSIPISTPISTSATLATGMSASPTPVSQSLQQMTPIATPATPTSPHQILDLQADIKKVLEYVVASHEEQRKMSKTVDELATKVKALNCVLCGDGGSPRKNTDRTVHKGGIAHRLIGMETAIDDLLGLVTSLKTDCRPPGPVAYYDTTTTSSSCTPSPPVRNVVPRYVDKSTDFPAPMSQSPSTHLSLRHPSNSLAHIDYYGAPNTRRTSLTALTPYLQKHNPGFQRGSSSSGSSESTTHQDPTASRDVFNTALLSVIHNASSLPVPNTSHTEVSANEPDRFLSSLATPSPSPCGENFGRANNKVNFSPFAGSQTGLVSLDKNLSAASSSRTPTQSCIPPKFSSRNSTSALKCKAAPSHLTPSTTPSKLSASNSVPILPTLLQPSPSTHTAIMHSTSPTRIHNSALSRARAASLSRMLSGVRPNVGGDVDCEGLCVDCEADRRGQKEHQENMDSQDQCTEKGTGTSFDIGEFGFPPRSAEADANESEKASPPVLGMALGVELVAPPAFETQPVHCTSSNDPSHVTAREHIEPCAPEPIWTREPADVNGDFHGTDPDESMQLDRVSDARGSDEVESDNCHEREDVGECVTEEDLRIESEDRVLDGLLDESVRSAEECSATALVPNTGNPNQQTLKDQYQGHPSNYRQELLTDPDDNVQSENVLSELCQPTPSDHLDQDELPHVEDSREPTPVDSLSGDEEAVAVLVTESLSPEDACTPSPSSPQRLSTFLPLQPENEHVLSGMQDQWRGATEPSKEFNHHDQDDFVAPDFFADPFSDFMNTDTDKTTSAIRGTYTEPHLDSQVQDLAATADYQEHVKISAQPKTVDPSCTVAINTLQYSTPTSISSRLSSLSALSSQVGSPPPLKMETNGGDERWNGTCVELRRTESLHSDEDSGTYGAHSGSSVSAPRTKMMPRSWGPRKSSASLALRGGPNASIEELSVLARRNPPKLNINLSNLKRKLESFGLATKQAGKRARFDEDAGKDMGTTISGMHTASSSFADSALDPNMESLMRQSSHPPMSTQDITASQTGSISTLVEVDSASAAGTISEPATMADSGVKRMASPANELQVDSIQVPEKRVRSLSQKARGSTAQKARQPRKSASGTNKRPPQKRKSKSLSFQEEPGGLICQWPEKSDQDGPFQRQFVQCDNCDMWYHFECVGIVEGDSRLEPEAIFICPPCCVSTAKRQTLRHRTEKCARPDCLHGHLDAQDYTIERLLGRKPVGKAGDLYLVKWEGYPIAQATWIPEGNMGGATQTIDRFVADARAEGINLLTKGAVLLEEARVGGWEV